jgi:urease accessory protein
MLSSATRLSVIGPLLAVRLQIEFIPVIEGLLNSRAVVSLFDSTEVSGEELIDISKCESYIHQTSPVLDLLQARHDMLYTRLFNS